MICEDTYRDIRYRLIHLISLERVSFVWVWRRNDIFKPYKGYPYFIYSRGIKLYRNKESNKSIEVDFSQQRSINKRPVNDNKMPILKKC